MFPSVTSLYIFLWKTTIIVLIFEKNQFAKVFRAKYSFSLRLHFGSSFEVASVFQYCALIGWARVFFVSWDKINVYFKKFVIFKIIFMIFQQSLSRIIKKKPLKI
jgi:hypothetical protein